MKLQKYISPKGVQAKPLKIPNYKNPTTINNSPKMWSPEGLAFHNNTTGGGAFGAAQRASAPDKGMIMMGDRPLNKKHSIKHKKKNWIKGAIKRPGALHAELGVKKGTKIPAKKLAAAAKKGGKEGKRARLAETLKGLKHKRVKMDTNTNGMSSKHKKQSEESIARNEQNASGKGGKGKFARKELHKSKPGEMYKKHMKKMDKTMCKKHKRMHCSTCG